MKFVSFVRFEHNTEYSVIGFSLNFSLLISIFSLMISLDFIPKNLLRIERSAIITWKKYFQNLVNHNVEISNVENIRYLIRGHYAPLGYFNFKGIIVKPHFQNTTTTTSILNPPSPLPNSPALYHFSVYFLHQWLPKSLFPLSGTFQFPLKKLNFLFYSSFLLLECSHRSSNQILTNLYQFQLLWLKNHKLLLRHRRLLHHHPKWFLF